jgi:hypothetical protein
VIAFGQILSLPDVPEQDLLGELDQLRALVADLLGSIRRAGLAMTISSGTAPTQPVGRMEPGKELTLFTVLVRTDPTNGPLAYLKNLS